MSDINIESGLFPPVNIATDIGNKQNFRLIKLAEEKYIYQQKYGSTKLTVFHD